MDVYEVLEKIVALLQRHGRLSYRALKVHFELDDDHLGLLKDELIDIQRVARDQDGKGLVWTGEVQSVAPAVSPEPDRSTPDAERRHLTVMFCDLADSTQLSRQLDPEDLREVVCAYQDTAADVIRQDDGHIAQYLGDGLLVYFGWPVAHEDDAQRAAYVGLGIVEALTTRLNPRLGREKGVQLTIRLGVHTGPVVVGEMGGGGRQENLATGDTVHIAARLEGLAPPNTVVVSRVTERLLRGAFAVEDLGSQMLKGVAEPMGVLRLLRPFDTDREADEGIPDDRVFLVGRDEEAGLLLRRWEQSKEGFGQVVLISGEAGIGKSSLVTTVRTHAAQAGYPRITLRCSPYHTNSALYPVIAYLEQTLGFAPDESPEARLEKLERGLRTTHLPLEDAVPLMATLLSVPLGDRYVAPTLSPRQHRHQTLDTLATWLMAASEKQPVLAVWEDLHWADPSTLELLGLILEQIPTVPMLHVLTFRRAGERANAHSAHVEALGHVARGLELLPLLPETPERTEHAMALYNARALALVATEGLSSPAVEAAYARTYELCQQIGEPPQLFSAVLGLCRLYSVRSEFRKALGFAEQLIALAQRQDASTRLPAAHWLMGANLLWCGEGLRARTHLEQGIALCPRQPHRALASLYGQDPGVMNRLFAALALWWLGYPDQARQCGDEALALAREITHPHSEASALVFTAWLHQLRREHQTVYDRAEAAMTLATEQGFTFWSAHGMFWLGWAQTKQGNWHEGIARMQHSLDDRQALGANASRSIFVAELAAAHGQTGQIDTACSLLGDALAIVDHTGERFYEAEVHRLRGALYLVQSLEHQQAAEIYYRKALDIARGQHAKSLELRAATSLARLWQSQDKRQEARELLAPVYGWFTEGFDTADLRDAAAVLEVLSEGLS